MQVVWNPEDGSDKKVWQFDPGDVGFKEAKEIEKNYEGTWDQWIQGLRTGDIGARGVLLWHMLRHEHPSLQYRDLPRFRIRQLTVEMGVAELQELWDKAQKMRLSADKREAFEMAFEIDMQEALAREGGGGHVSVVDGQLMIEWTTELPKPV